MEKIVVGFLGCGNIGCGVYKLLETYGAQITKASALRCAKFSCVR